MTIEKTIEIPKPDGTIIRVTADWLTFKELLFTLAITKNTFYRYYYTLPCIRVGRQRRFKIEDVENIESYRRGGLDPDGNYEIPQRRRNYPKDDEPLVDPVTGKIYPVQPRSKTKGGAET